MAHSNGPDNAIVGPGGEVVGRPSQVPTGIASHISFLVREVKGIKEAMARKVLACEQELEERRKEDDDSRPYGPSPWAIDIFTEIPPPSGDPSLVDRRSGD